MLTKKQKWVSQVLAICFVFIASFAYALDDPHSEANSYGCGNCHDFFSSNPYLIPDWVGDYTPSDPDDTPLNHLCRGCHYGGGPAPAHEAHSYAAIGYTSATSQFGPWQVECSTCHNPHYQDQYRNYRWTSETYWQVKLLVDSRTASATSSTVTAQGPPSWTVDEHVDLYLVPNIDALYPTAYKILGNTADTLTVNGQIDLANVNNGDSFTIIYGRLIRKEIKTQNILNPLNPKPGVKVVRFFNASGTHSFADGDTAYDGICEVCHTETSHFRNDGTGSDQNHTNQGTIPGQNCANTCHPANDGFKPSGCNTCHGFPPGHDGGTLLVQDKLGNPIISDSVVGTGSHPTHFGAGWDCTNCHTGGMVNVTQGDYKINLGFNYFGNLPGNYDGNSTRTIYTYSATAPTTVTLGDTNTCSSLFCHSTGQSTTSGTDPTPTYSSPVWGTPSTGACGTCHKVDEGLGLTSGSHGAHLNTVGVTGCSECHTGAADNASSYSSGAHRNKQIDVANSYTAAGTPGNGYGICTTADCHDNGKGVLIDSPLWGTVNSTCSACHGEVPADANHQAHAVVHLTPCAECHKGAVQATTAPIQHLDTNIDVYEVNPGDLGYPTNKAKGTAFDSCDTAYCHSTGQSTTSGTDPTPTYASATWGNAASAACGTCHKVSEATGLNSGSHEDHLGTSGVNGCGDCHTGAANNASSYNSTNHVNRLIDVANTYSASGTPGNGYGTCSAAVCHNNGLGTPAVTPVWGSQTPACSACHEAVMSTGSHTKHLAASALCGDCHYDAVQSVSPPSAGHIDDTVDVLDTTGGDLGYPQNVALGSGTWTTCDNASCHADGFGTKKTTPVWGGPGNGCSTCHEARPTSGMHAKHINSDALTYGLTTVDTTSGTYDFGCGNCHPIAAEEATYHRNGVIDIVLNKNDGGTLKSLNNVSNDTSGYAQSTGSNVTCSAAYCHSKGDGTFTVTSPNWYGAYSGDTCGHCHTNQPDTNAHPIHVVGTHYDELFSGTTGLLAIDATPGSAHGNAATSMTISCNTCHNDTVSLAQNDQNSICGTCHDGGVASLKGDAEIRAGSTSHINGTKDVVFNAITMRGKAQLRDDIDDVDDVGTYWNRNTAYKSSATDHDNSKALLNIAKFNVGACSSVACHSGNTVLWNNGPLTCSQCHSDTPQ